MWKDSSTCKWFKHVWHDSITCDIYIRTNMCKHIYPYMFMCSCVIQQNASMRMHAYVFILQAPPNLHPFCSGGLVRPRTFCILLFGRFLFRVQIRVVIEFRSSQSRPSQMWETHKQMWETNELCVPFDVFLFHHWEWCEKVDHVRHRGLKRMCRQAIFTTSIFCRSLSALQTPCSVARNS